MTDTDMRRANDTLAINWKTGEFISAGTAAHWESVRAWIASLPPLEPETDGPDQSSTERSGQPTFRFLVSDNERIRSVCIASDRNGETTVNAVLRLAAERDQLKARIAHFQDDAAEERRNAAAEKARADMLQSQLDDARKVAERAESKLLDVRGSDIAKIARDALTKRAPDAVSTFDSMGWSVGYAIGSLEAEIDNARKRAERAEAELASRPVGVPKEMRDKVFASIDQYQGGKCSSHPLEVLRDLHAHFQANPQPRGWDEAIEEAAKAVARLSAPVLLNGAAYVSKIDALAAVKAARGKR